MKTPADVIRGDVEGYAGKLSYLPGERLTIHCSARQAKSSVTVEIARVGKDRKVVWRQDAVDCDVLPTPPDAAAEGCDWPATIEFDIPHDWDSGFYEVLFVADPADETLAAPAFFVLRSTPGPARPKALLVLSTNTYNAYNDWGGDNLYTGGIKVSFKRPTAVGFLRRPDGELFRAATAAGTYDPDLARQHEYLAANRVSGWCAAAGWFNWEHPFVVWAEENGIELDYAVNSDLETVPDLLDGVNLIVSVGHDEYWSWGMRDTVEDFVARGGNVAFFSGNVACWQIRFDDQAESFTSYKYDAPLRDPVFGTDEGHLLTGKWSDRTIGRPENAMTGVSFTRGGYARVGLGVPRGSGGYDVCRPDHWVFAETGLRYGDLLGATNVVVGYEADGCEFTIGDDGLPKPTGADGTPETFTILATSPARLWSNKPGSSDFPAAAALPDGELGDLEYVVDRLIGDQESPAAHRLGHGHAVMGVYQQGGTVFTTGCTDWAYGLRGRDPLVEQITLNVMSRLSAAESTKATS